MIKNMVNILSEEEKVILSQTTLSTYIPPPTIKEELERKVLEEVATLNRLRLRGAISEYSYISGLAVVYGITSGLLDWAILDAIIAEENQIKPELEKNKMWSVGPEYDGSLHDARVFVKGPSCAFINRNYGDPFIEIGTNTSSSIKHIDFYDQEDPSKSAMDKQNEMSALFIKDGWVRRI